MFEVGKYYRFKMIDEKGEQVEYAPCLIEEENLPLVRTRDVVSGETIVNTASSAFISACLAARD